MFLCMTHAPTTLATVNEVGRRLNVSDDVVRAWCRTGQLRHFIDGIEYQAVRLPGGKYRIPLVIVDAIERGDFNPNAQPARAA
jgi:hypothetical protein